jgi:diguanylate cyclase (GGDEF)-like protein/PAS domain S-box-containing protein
VNRDEYNSLSCFIDLIIDTICIVDKTGHFEYVSASSVRIFGYTADEMIGMQMLDLVYYADRDRTIAAAKNIMQGHEHINFENRYVRKDGQIVDILWSARWSETHQQRIAVARDISERKNTERRQAALYAISEAAHIAEDLPAFYQEIHHIIEQLLPATHFAIANYEANTSELTFLYKATTAQKSHAGKTDLVPFTRNVSSTKSNDNNNNHNKNNNNNNINDNINSFASILNEEDASYEAFCRQVILKACPLLATPNHVKDYPEEIGEILNLSQLCWLGMPLTQQHTIVGVLMVHSDISDRRYTIQDQELMEYVSTQIATAIERKQMLARLKYIALHDPLTQLPNRTLFHDRIQVALTHAKRADHSLSLLYLDLDKFKRVNDTCGHHIGDALLKMTAQRILHCVRETDTVSRFGGDEFVILLDDIGSKANSLQIAKAILQALNQPFKLAEKSLYILPSIGIALYPEHGLDEAQLLASSDAAMYRAKKNGGNYIEISNSL